MAAASSASAQGSVAQEGALWLLVPIGARAVGMGQAATATRLGAEGVWWNPASIGWLTQREVGIDYSTIPIAPSIATSVTSLDVVIPAGRAGTVAASLLYFNFGDLDATDGFGTVTGHIYSRSIVPTVTYAATFGPRVSAGVTYKYVNKSDSCSGECASANPTSSISTSAFDLGVQYTPDSARRLTLGASIRDLGLGLQTIDREQTDPMPTRVHVGASYLIPGLRPEFSLEVTGEFIGRFTDGSPELRAGAELGVVKTLYLRGGVMSGGGAGSPDGSTGALGLGFRKGLIGVEFARSFGGTTGVSGEAPTYLTFRFGFR